MSNSENEKDKQELQASSESVEKIPEPVRSFFSSFFASRQPVFPPFMEKINEEHINKVLDYSEKQDERDFAEAQAERKFAFARFIVIALVFAFTLVFLTLYLAPIDKELYRDVLKIGLGFLSGAGLAGGVAYHLGRKAASKNED
jgi:hypothetical protein